MKVKHIKKSTLIESTWSGGTTTELYISPINSDYKKQTFNWRLSTATVDLETSTFTSLPGIKRHIMSLTTPLKLVHKNHHSVTLNSFEVDTFEGVWETSSYGKVTDYNLMLNQGFTGVLKAITVNNTFKFDVKETCINMNHSNLVLTFYAIDFDIKVTIDEIEYNLEKGDLLIVEEISLNTPYYFQTNQQKPVHIATALISKDT